jgi:hypothetical protein
LRTIFSAYYQILCFLSATILPYFAANSKCFSRFFINEDFLAFSQFFLFFLYNIASFPLVQISLTAPGDRDTGRPGGRDFHLLFPPLCAMMISVGATAKKARHHNFGGFCHAELFV